MTQQDLSMTGRGTGTIAFPHDFICGVGVVETPGTTEIAFSRTGAPQEGDVGAAGQGWEHQYHAAIGHSLALSIFPIPGHHGASLKPRSSAHPWGVQRAVVPWDCSPSVGGKTYQEFRSAWSSVSCAVY